ncbi:MAG TPA: FAD-dependent thymidylate synthase [Syntrophothermus lipocalidus]|uniref:Flavin-dependent thymidylate synthase n=1 Tax=Syntrophothermus lipocalidus (strain DSM 12680 / TGB-C1) TaxID=643648 RepID=D7CJP3_SYNLT|nr:FAD-dependent thymidylate synthase [Syntrophothermus lipocalidus]ADI02998.1 thymidylate synthase, flavin-dependent [Syntrophothermus lipocalidus DSM 12680]HHV77805.1 FAD-dependent thymidylate synthase [Syntrophothermus lipocalidus]HOV66379.1 FAD-dependent thymidylate synthase [Bacillota bacterium]
METRLKVRLLQHTYEPEKLVAVAAKLCYSPSGIDGIMEGLDSKTTSDFLNMLTELGHESPIEHATFTFGIEGVSRSLLAQITRHRIASYSVKSQRWVREDQFDYVIPPEIQAIPAAKDIFEKAMQEDQAYYRALTEILFERHFKKLLEEGKDEKVAKREAEKQAIEDARYVLPNACETKLIVTMNARSLFNFFRQRCCNRAQWEIRRLAEEMLRLVRQVAPTLFAKAGPGCYMLGKCPEGKMSCGKSKEIQEKYRNLTGVPIERAD